MNTSTVSLLFLVLATVPCVAALGYTVWFWKERQDHVTFVHMTSMMALTFVLVGSWATYLASSDVRILDRPTAQFLAAMGRGSFLVLVLFFFLLFRHHDWDDHDWDDAKD